MAKIISVDRLTASLKKILSSHFDRYNANKNDYKVVLHAKCNCSDCGKLQKFLLSPNENTLSWPMAKDRRRHIHNIIDRSEFSITHKTKRVGSPQSLIITKDKSIPSFCSKMKEKYEKLIKQLDAI